MSRSPKPLRAISLIELIISIALLALVITGFFGIEVFSRYHLLTADRRAKLQNEASYLVEHMSKQLLAAMGDYEHPGVTRTTSEDGFYLDAVVDANADGIRNDSSDRTIRYCFACGDCGIAGEKYFVYFQPDVKAAGPGERLVRHVQAFSADLDDDEKNLLVVNLTSCWEPDPVKQKSACGTSENPSISVQTTVRLPSVSVN